ncbi:MAG: hypothetical protein DRN49_02250 [Thaumarchaeota archaeon]|nr:MAG: hypothetical protein DRN49_02250 [Nitrososphaerota archaeon]
MKYTRVRFLNIVKSLQLTSPSEKVPLKLAPVILLGDDAKRIIAVAIKENFSLIEGALRGDSLNPHRLLVSILKKLNIEIVKAVIYSLEESYCAKLFLQTRVNEKKVEVEAEPCDAIVISILAKAPIFVEEKTMQEFSIDASKIPINPQYIVKNGFTD